MLDSSAMPPIKADTKYSAFEYETWFNEPIFETFRIPTVVQAIYEALAPWNISTENVKYASSITTPNDPVVSFQLARNLYSLSLCIAGLKFKAESVDWEQAPAIIGIIEAARVAVSKAVETVTIKRHQLQIIMQLAPARAIKDLTKPFAGNINRQDLDFYGLVLYTKDGLFLVDRSVADATNLFVKIQRRFEADKNMDEMAANLHDDEKWLAGILNIEIV